MATRKTLTAATLAALMASTSVASAGQVGDGAVFSSDSGNTVVNMTADEMQATQGEFVFTAATTFAAVSAGASLFMAGMYLGDQAHQKWGG